MRADCVNATEDKLFYKTRIWRDGCDGAMTYRVLYDFIIVSISEESVMNNVKWLEQKLLWKNEVEQ